MNIKAIISLLLGVLLLNTALALIPIPGTINLIVLAGAIILLFIDGTKSGLFGKASFVLAAIIAIYALPSILSFIGISVPLEKLVFVLAGILLIINPFVNS
ncbi:MAG: hypothetical protein U9O94_08820 [Nanoarchaeota archaeon]|nr:hypothetical protein [Nanoarchaeota archaeon]